MKKLLFASLLLIAALVACRQPAKVKFVINNQTGDIMDSVKVVPNSDIQHLYTNLMPQEVGSYFAELGDVQGDGDFTLSYRKPDSKRDFSFHIGYFTNGAPTEKEYFVEIWRDTVIVKSDLKAF
jgi:hypothetical protein